MLVCNAIMHTGWLLCSRASWHVAYHAALLWTQQQGNQDSTLHAVHAGQGGPRTTRAHATAKSPLHTPRFAGSKLPKQINPE